MKMTQCPKCKEFTSVRVKGRKKKNWGHFECTNNECENKFLSTFENENKMGNCPDFIVRRECRMELGL